MLKEKKEKLKNNIDKIIKEIGHRNDIKQEIGREFLNRNIPAHRAMNVFMSIEDLNTIGDSDNDIRFLFIFTLALEKALKDNADININTREYFTELEYKQWLNYREEPKSSNIYPIIFENTQQIANGIWQTTLTAQHLAELNSDNVILYNFKTQRSPKITVSGVKIDYDKQKTVEIKNRMLNGEQFPDHIKLNILNNFKEKINYNSKTQILTVGEGSSINIFDGYHRKVANSLAVEENNEISFTWPIIITNLTENAAKDYMVQIDKQKPIKKEQIKSWDLSKMENLVVSVISDDKISKLNKIMKDQYSEIKHNKGLVTKNIIAESIAENYELNDTTDIRGLGGWIVEFTDYLFSLYPSEFITDPYSNKEHSVINHKNMFHGYIALSSKLYNNQNWKKILENKMQSIDFSTDNEIWKDIGILTGKVNKSQRNKIYKLFMEGVR